MYFVYIIQHSETKQIYIGSTSDLNRRLIEHNSHNTKATHRTSGEWSMRYAEIYIDKQNALDREYKLKHHGSAKQKLLKRIEKIYYEIKSGAGSGERVSNTLVRTPEMGITIRKSS